MAEILCPCCDRGLGVPELPKRGRPLSHEQRYLLVQLHKKGIPWKVLSRSFNRSAVALRLVTDRYWCNLEATNLRKNNAATEKFLEHGKKNRAATRTME